MVAIPLCFGILLLLDYFHLQPPTCTRASKNNLILLQNYNYIRNPKMTDRITEHSDNYVQLSFI
jgi:hypothetical protein